MLFGAFVYAYVVGAVFNIATSLSLVDNQYVMRRLCTSAYYAVALLVDAVKAGNVSYSAPSVDAR